MTAIPHGAAHKSELHLHGAGRPEDHLPATLLDDAGFRGIEPRPVAVRPHPRRGAYGRVGACWALVPGE